MESPYPVKASSESELMLLAFKSRWRNRCRRRNASLGTECKLLSPSRKYCRFSVNGIKNKICINVSSMTRRVYKLNGIKLNCFQSTIFIERITAKRCNEVKEVYDNLFKLFSFLFQTKSTPMKTSLWIIEHPVYFSINQHTSASKLIRCDQWTTICHSAIIRWTC